jgi:hypothetical protein
MDPWIDSYLGCRRKTFIILPFDLSPWDLRYVVKCRQVLYHPEGGVIGSSNRSSTEHDWMARLKCWIAGGTEACVDAISMGSFGKMRALETRYNDSPSAASRPFDVARGGFVIGEGAGVVVLEEMQHAIRRQATVYAEVS